jgi:hypothetical protein
MEEFALLIILGAIFCPLLTLSLILAHLGYHTMAFVVFVIMIAKWAIKDKER